MPIVSASNPRLFDPRISDATTSLDQYVGTETEIDPKQARAPMLFDRRIGSDRATATHYAGADTEIDPKPPGARFRQNRDSDLTAGAQQGSKKAPSLFRQRSNADFATATQFSGLETEMDPKPPTILSRHQFDAGCATATRCAATDTETDVKEAPRLFDQIRAADPITAAQYLGTDTEMDQKISDRRLKREIRRIGVSPSGLPIYSFRYVWGGPIYVGVMAQDLLATRPDAVIQSEGGYLLVDYDKIDVKMTSLDSHDALPVAAEESGASSPPALFARRRVADKFFGAQYIGVESEADVKPPAYAAADQYVGTDTEMDVKPSDRRLKREIRRIGVSPSGLPIYSFRYVWGGPTFVGVMAQDLLATRPDAVIESEGGYLMVDYDKIDVKMTNLSNPALFARRRSADKLFGAQHIGVESEADVKPPVTYAAARYVGTDTEIDVKSV